MVPTIGIAAFSHDSPLAPWQFKRRDLGPHDVRIDIDFCGICHSDVHTVRAEWGSTYYPLVPGHEITGRVVETGPQVVKWLVGDKVGVGCMVDSCRSCSSCSVGLEQYCLNGNTGTYGGTEKETGLPTQGGYSGTIVVNEDFILRIPSNLDQAAAAPLLCAGITTWSPLRHWNISAGSRVGVVGVGGLGHMAIKLAAALGAEVVAITSSNSKAADAMRLGATNVIVGYQKSSLKPHRDSLDLIIDTVSAPHDLDQLVKLLRLNGTLCLVGISPEAHPMPGAFSLIGRRRSIAGSLIGGVSETQEMLDFCGAHDITSDIELIEPAMINDAWRRMVSSDVKYRFVIDTASLRNPH